MAKQTDQVKPKAEIVGISINFDIRYRDPSNDQSPETNLSDNAYLDFRNEQALNRIIAEKPYLADIVPILAAKFAKELDAANTAGSDLKSKVTGILSA